jgi:hypothetical protein
MVNDHNRVITIVNASVLISSPTGEVEESLTLLDQNGFSLGFFATLRPEKDVNCDGEVSELEASLENPELEANCLYDLQNPSFIDEYWVLSDLLPGVDKTNRVDYRGQTYQVKIIFEGWEGDFNNPISNFFKEINFTMENR